MNNATEQEFFRCVNNYKIYSVVFKGESLSILKEITGGSEVACHNDNLPSYIVLANVTDEIRKLLDDDYVICHVQADKTQKGLIEYTIMLGESL